MILIALSAQRISSQNAPITTAGNIVSTGMTVIVPITAANFTNVASCNLRFSYDQAIVTAISVTKGPSLPGNLASNVTNPGLINLGWYHSANVTLPPNTVIFNISFTKVTSGTSPLSFVDNGNSCKFSDIYSVALIDVPTANYYINGSVTFQDFAPKTFAPLITSCPGSLINVPITVKNFNTIGSVSLTMNYNPAVLSYIAPITNNIDFPELTADVDEVSGTVIIGGFPSSGSLTFPDNTVLITLHFTYLGGYTGLNWYDNGTSCEYSGPLPVFPALNDIPFNSFYTNGSVGPAPTDWTGASNNNWENPGNWTCGLPGINDNVTINNSPNYPAISGDVVISGLTIITGNVTINSAGTLTVSNSLTNNAGNDGLVINSGGSLIESSSGINATVKRDIHADEWHLISSPVQDAVSGLFLAQYLQTHDEHFKSYIDILDINAPLEVMKGYALWTVNNPYTASFKGSLNTGAIGSEDNLVRSGADDPAPDVDLYGWNLVGNPYPSSIDWLATGWTKTNVENATYVHVNSSTWATFVGGSATNGGSQYIAPCQGFFVHVPGPSFPSVGTLQMTNAVRTHNSTSFFKNAVSNLVRLEVSGNGYKDEAVVRFLDEATLSFDGEYDAHKLFGDVAEAAQLYTLGSSPLAINALPETTSVPVGLRALTAGVYCIAATEVNDLSAILLEDTKTGIFTDLLKGAYAFDFTPGENEVRFMLHFSPLSVSENESTVASIYSVDKTVFIDLTNQAGSEVFIYTIAGQLVKTMQLTKGLNRISVETMGNYLVKVITKESTFVKKVFIK